MHRIAAQRFNVNVPLAACVIAVGRQGLAMLGAVYVPKRRCSGS